MIQNCLVKPTLHEGMYNNICCHTNSEVVQAFAIWILKIAVLLSIFSHMEHKFVLL